MNLANIETFLTIVETQSLSKASERLFVSQSTVSTRLNTLEQDLNLALIKRQPGKKIIELTPKGEEFVTVAKRWMSLKEDTNMWINQESPLSLNIGSVDSLNIYVLSPLFNQMIVDNTPLKIEITSHSSVQVFNALENHDIDIGLVSRLIRNNSLLSEPVFSEGMVLISSAIYSNYADVIHPNDLDVTKEIFLDWGPNFKIWHDYWWDPAEPIKITVDTAGLILKFINISNTWAIVPRTIAHGFESIQPIRVSELLKPPDERIYYKIIHRYPKSSSIQPIKIFEQQFYKFIKAHPYLQEFK